MLKGFLKSPFNIAGLSIIGVVFLAAFSGYLITPDSSQNANHIALGISNKPMGFSCNVLTNKKHTSTSFFHKWLFGEKPSSVYIPIYQYRFQPNGNLLYSEWGDENTLKHISKKALTPLTIITKKYHWGTDRYGRDLLSRMIIGARVSLTVGMLSVFISLFIGTSIGMCAGYFRGFTDKVLSWFIAVFWALPTLLIVMGLSFAFGKGFSQILLAIGLSTWVEVARVVRGQTLQIREKEFILSCKISGFSSMRILWVHILPNLKGTLSVLATTNFASAILLEAGLSFLGLGIAPPVPTWGNMIQEHFGYLVLPSAHLAIIPGLAIMILVTGFNFLSMGFRDAFDPFKRNT